MDESSQPPPPPGPAASPRGAVRTVLVLALGGEQYAVDLANTREILRYRRPTPLPHTPSYLEGVIAIRGAVVPVFDLWLRMGLGSGRKTASRRLVVVSAPGGELAALRVDEILGVRRLTPDEVSDRVENESPMVAAVASGRNRLRVLDLEAVLHLETAHE